MSDGDRTSQAALFNARAERDEVVDERDKARAEVKRLQESLARVAGVRDEALTLLARVYRMGLDDSDLDATGAIGTLLKREGFI